MGNVLFTIIINMYIYCFIINADCSRIVPKRIRLELISGKTHSEINEMLNAANCLLLTSLHEGSPNIVKESMACNLPVVTVNCGDVAIRLSDVTPSFVSKDYNANELADLLRDKVHALAIKARAPGEA